MTTSQPSNTSEWQLYRVLQRANLLQYYDTFIAQGGDDVQQLCEAGEEEFLEIMALVGMASKPLHVRRLQKALQEWVQNPQDVSFQNSGLSSNPAPGSITAVARDQLHALGYTMHSTNADSKPNLQSWSPQSPQPSSSPTPRDTGSPSSTSPQQTDIKDVTLIDDYNQGVCGYSLAATSQHSPSPVSCITSTPILIETQINAIASAAEKLATGLRPFEPKELNLKKQINRDIQNVMHMSDDIPNRLEELRKYAAIYGRFDSKRKNDRPMSLHEISVNEAAAQLCRHMPPLITRREDLFPLARQVVKDSGYQYSKGHSREGNVKDLNIRLNPERQELTISRAGDGVVPSKKRRIDPVFERKLEAYRKSLKPDIDKTQAKNRISEIKAQISKLKDREEDIKIQITVATKADCKTLIDSLETELNSAKAEHVQLLTEQSKILTKLNQLEQYEQSGFSEADGSSLDELARVLLNPQLRHSASKLVQETLFDEGLRIAQQYGMADFAEELKGLQTQKDPNDNASDSDGLRSPSPCNDDDDSNDAPHNDSDDDDISVNGNERESANPVACRNGDSNSSSTYLKSPSTNHNGIKMELKMEASDDYEDRDSVSFEPRSKLPSLGFSTDPPPVCEQKLDTVTNGK